MSAIFDISILEIIITLIFGAFTYLLGVRITKERADRSTYREMYQEIYNHFRDLKEKIDSGCPRSWDDYKKADNQFLPLMCELESNGRINMIPSKLSNLLLKIEKDAFSQSFAYYKYLEKEIIPYVRLFIENRVESPQDPVNGRPHISLNVGQIALHPQATREKIERIVGEGSEGISVEFAMKRGQTYRLYVFPEKIKSSNVSPIDIFDLIKDHLANDGETAKYAENFRSISNEIADIKQIISHRIKDPHPLFDTISEMRTEFINKK